MYTPSAQQVGQGDPQSLKLQGSAAVTYKQSQHTHIGLERRYITDTRQRNNATASLVTQNCHHYADETRHLGLQSSPSLLVTTNSTTFRVTRDILQRSSDNDPATFE